MQPSPATSRPASHPGNSPSPAKNSPHRSVPQPPLQCCEVYDQVRPHILQQRTAGVVSNLRQQQHTPTTHVYMHVHMPFMPHIEGCNHMHA